MCVCAYTYIHVVFRPFLFVTDIRVSLSNVCYISHAEHIAQHAVPVTARDEKSKENLLVFA